MCHCSILDDGLLHLLSTVFLCTGSWPRFWCHSSPWKHSLQEVCPPTWSKVSVGCCFNRTVLAQQVLLSCSPTLYKLTLSKHTDCEQMTWPKIELPATFWPWLSRACDMQPHRPLYCCVSVTSHGVTLCYMPHVHVLIILCHLPGSVVASKTN